MAFLNDFELALKDVVNAKRLSASKMTKLTEIAMKSMDDDTQLVSILYRTHKSLPAAAKVSSLYVFDALSRAARHSANKHSLIADLNSKKGNAATFLLKIEGVLDGLFQDMVSTGTPEAKEKCQKVLDIWGKGSTFPPTVLQRLGKVMKGENVQEHSSSTTPRPTVDPRIAAHAPPKTTTPPTTPPTPALDPQAALLALLTKAVSVNTSHGQTPVNTAQIPPQGQTPPLEASQASQIALLKRLTQTASLASATSAPNPLASVQSHTLVYTNGFPAAVMPPPHPSHSPPNHHESYTGPPRRDPRYDRHGSPDQGKGYDNYDDRNRPPRGGFRGRGRGGGDWQAGRDDHDRFRDGGTSRSPPPRRRHSRSRSPPSRHSRRDTIKPYSPPHRPSLTKNIPTITASGGALKDEFGRDIRPQSQTPEPATALPSSAAVADSSPGNDNTEQPMAVSPPGNPVETSSPAVPAHNNHVQTALAPSIANAPSSDSSTSNITQTTPSQLGMDSFNIAMFDFTSPAAWESLGKMWQVTYNQAPSTEQLMQFVMSAANGMTQIPAVTVPQQQQQWSAHTHGGVYQNPGSNWRGSSEVARGGFQGGRGGGFNRSSGYYQQGYQMSGSGLSNSDAIVLGGASQNQSSSTPAEDGQLAGTSESAAPATSSDEAPRVGSAGRMQRVGDKWMFVRDAPVAQGVS